MDHFALRSEPANPLKRHGVPIPYIEEIDRVRFLHQRFKRGRILMAGRGHFGCAPGQDGP